MNNCFATRRIDDLGRVHIPREVRERFGISTGDEIELSIENDTLCLRKKIKSHYDRIRSMNIDEMAIEHIYFVPDHKEFHYTGLSGLYTKTAEETIQNNIKWLKSEVTE